MKHFYRQLIIYFIEANNLTKEEFCARTGVTYPSLIKALNNNDDELALKIFKAIYHPITKPKPILDINTVPVCFKTRGDFYFCKRNVKMASNYERYILSLFGDLSKVNQNLIITLMKKLKNNKTTTKRIPPVQNKNICFFV